MASQKKQSPPSRRRGALFLASWFTLIVAGIVAKRVYGHPDMMVFFHLPAAVCLVIASYQLSWQVRQRYRESLAKFSR